ncbi:hypothetical protein P879_08055 [Paragonimus westermani]|uniref:Transmembrane protein 107 n=1 Tax=Paragonimus westermani TaxID=34504 RepID=A0A8T0D6V1_9TREM|nr:hypothetical protein P879_08055 [Paragonimus westermani]
MGSTLHSLIPSRFLIILAHLILCLSLLLSERSQLIETSLPKRFSAVEAKYTSDLCIVAFSLSVIFVLFELVGFLSGATMFMVSYNLVSIIFHFSGVISTSFFIVETWNLQSYWYIFVGTICIPLLLETTNVISKIWCKHSL